MNIISPGPISTLGLDSVLSEGAKNYIAGTTALQRLGNPDEIAKTDLFLGSDASSYISGIEITVDDGYHTYSLK